MKKLELHFGIETILTKEQMRKVKGGETCTGYADCYDGGDNYCGQISGAVDCNDIDSLQYLCLAFFGTDCDYLSSCTCTG